MANIFSLFGTVFIDSEKANKSIDDINSKGKGTKKTILELSDGCWNLSKKMSVAFAGGVTAITGIVEATKEFRQDLGKLQTSFELAAEGGIETGTKTFKELYSVLGEDDTAIEAANNLVALTGDAKNLSSWTKILTGVYATFGDALPIEGLAEAANETAKVGTVTGGLADAINWAKIPAELFGNTLKSNTNAQTAYNKAIAEGGSREDAFNAALAACNNESERESLIRNTLNALYDESAEVYQETNKSVMDNNNAQADLNLKLAEMATKIEPLITKGKIFLLEVLDKAQPYITFIIDNLNVIGPLVAVIWGSITALGIISKIMTLKTVLGGFFTFIGANPIVLVIGAIIAILYLLITNWDKVKDSIKLGVFFMIDKFNFLKDKVSAIFNSIKTAIQNVFNGLIYVVKIPINMWISYINFFIKALNKIKLPDFLGGWGINIPLIPKLRVGMDYVPYDEMPALLHKGERVLTAEENEKYNENKKDNSNNITYNNVINIEKVEVREDKDINRIAEELYWLQKKEAFI